MRSVDRRGQLHLAAFDRRQAFARALGEDFIHVEIAVCQRVFKLDIGKPPCPPGAPSCQNDYDRAQKTQQLRKHPDKHDHRHAENKEQAYPHHFQVHLPANDLFDENISHFKPSSIHLPIAAYIIDYYYRAFRRVRQSRQM